MKKNIKYCLFLLLFMLCFVIKVEAAVVNTCYYNDTGVGSNEDYLVKIDIYDDKSAKAAFKDGASGDISNWTTDYADECPLYFRWNQYEVCTPGVLIPVCTTSESYNVLDKNSYDQIESYYEEGSSVSYFPTIRFFHLIDDNDAAEKTTCNYGDFEVILNSNSKIIKINYLTNTGVTYYPTIETTISSSQVESDKCPSIQVCEGNEDLYGKNTRLLLYGSDNASKMNVEKCVSKSPSSNQSESLICNKYNDLYAGDSEGGTDGLTQYAENYKACFPEGSTTTTDAGCIADTLEQYNSQKDKLKNWCNTMLGSSDYNNDCVKQCLNVSKQIAELENEMGINSYGEDNGDCSFSGRLLQWIGNAIRILKYIVPILIIILSILDFIKVIGASKEDEMKKMQGKFVRRLIIAALIFIIPFIIEFVLEAFGFEADGCGIINL